jgi:glycogen operon protein
MPIFQFDAKRVIRDSPLTGEPLRNYWGYDPIGLFAPHSGYCVSASTGTHLDEFRDLVKAAHRMGLEVILDVVFNHTGERNETGPTVCFRGVDNAVYYMVSGDDGAGYLDLTGCLNTLNCGHPVMADLIRDALAHWVEVMHVDGFRFDLASILMLDDTGRTMNYPPALWACRLDPRLAGIKLIAEPFGTIDSLADFPDDRFVTWNYRLRDTVRRFVRGDRGLIGEVATRIAGSSDFYQPQGKTPLSGVSYVTCHDGMTLNDVVTFARPHNEPNGEVSGNPSEISANYGAEGPDQGLEPLRLNQIKNHLVVLLLSQGIPMLLAGDECRRTQLGNNNAYLQDNALSWFDWTLPTREAELERFVRELIAFRKRHPGLRRESFFTGEIVERGLRDISWHGCDLDQPGFGDPNSGVLAFTIAGAGGAEDVHAILNMESQQLSFALPSIAGRSWFKAVDTSERGPADIVPSGSEIPVTTGRLEVQGRTAVVLVAR